MAIAKWVRLAFALAAVAGVSAGCDTAPPPAPAAAPGVAPASLTIPADVGPPVVSCADGSSYTLSLPCQMGQGPVFETDCAYGPDGAGKHVSLKFMLPESLPDAGGSLTSGPPLGTPQRFHAVLVPGSNAGAPGDLSLTSAQGTITFTEGSLADRRLDGWFTHLDFVFASSTGALPCALDNGRFTTVPGDFL